MVALAFRCRSKPARTICKLVRFKGGLKACQVISEYFHNFGKPYSKSSTLDFWGLLLRITAEQKTTKKSESAITETIPGEIVVQLPQRMKC